jgi:subtilisin family serine protease
VYLPTGSTVIIVLEWNDQFEHSGNDYDLYLSQNVLGDLGFSGMDQSGSGDPLEIISFTNFYATIPIAEIDVHKWSGDPKNLEIYIFPMDGALIYPFNLVSSDSIFGHAAVPNAVAVAAAPASSPSTIEYFSSLGPVTIAYPSPETRQKPDITGIDGVAVTGAGGFPSPFYGTSAAAPHIAAVVAQTWEANPYLTPAQVRSALYSSAVDLGTAGRDTTFGYGRADALAMAFSQRVNITTNTVSVVRGNSFTVTVAGRNSTNYWVYLRNASVASGYSYPQIPDGQPMVNITFNPAINTSVLPDLNPAWSASPGMNRTVANITTQSDGTQALQFDTTNQTYNTTYTIKVVDPLNLIRNATVNVTVERGQVTIAYEGTGTYNIG